MNKLVLLLALLLLGSAAASDEFITEGHTTLAPPAISAPAPADAPVAAPLSEARKVARSLVRVRTKFAIEKTKRDKDGKRIKDIKVYMGGGTGFAVSPTIIWTAKHVVTVGDGGKVIERYVVLPDGKKIAVVSFRTLVGDAAEVSLAAPHGLPCLKVASSAPKAWAKALVIGFPGYLKTWVSGVGHAKKVTNAPYWLPSLGSFFLEITMPLRKGMSGGPLLVNGEVVAVVSCMGPTFPGMDKRYFCARCDRVAVMLHEAALRAARKPKADPAPSPKPKAPRKAPVPSGDACPPST